MWKLLKPSHKNLRFWQLLVLVVVLGVWHIATRNEQTAFFFGEPLKVAVRIWQWFTVGSGSLEVGFGDTTFFTLNFPAEIYSHLLITLTETVVAFVIGTAFGLGIGLSLAVTLVFFVVFFNVYQGVKEVSPVVLANARMLGANARQLLRTVYLPSATSWVFSSLHTSIGLAFVGAVVGEYLGSARGVGYLILQAEGSFDINTVFAGIVVLTAFALVLDVAVGMIEKRLMKWQPKSGETEKL